MCTNNKIYLQVCIIMIIALGLSSCSDSPSTRPIPSTDESETEETIMADVRSKFSAALEKFGELNSYHAKQEYLFVLDTSNPDEANGISITADCSVNVEEDSSHCNNKVIIKNNGEITEIKSELVAIKGVYSFKREGEEWQTITALDAQVPGLVEGRIDPIPFLNLIMDGISDSSELEYDQIYAFANVESFLITLFGSEEGQTFFEAGREFSINGYVVVGEEDGQIHEHYISLEFFRDVREMRIQLTQTISDFDKPVTILKPNG